MNWFLWALLSAFFAGLTAVLAKVGVQQIDSNMATAIRTVVILIFAWAVALVTKNAAVFGNWQTHLDFSDSVGDRHQLLLAVLFPRLAIGRSLAGRSGGQTQRRRGHRAGRNFPSRTNDVAPLGRRRAHFYRSSRVGLRVRRELNSFSSTVEKPRV